MTDPLRAIVPVDGRYWDKLEPLSDYFSEYALIKERLFIEVKYLIKFMEDVEPDKLAPLRLNWREALNILAEDFTLDDAKRVKQIESEVGHDVAAVVRYLREKLHEFDLGDLAPYVHIGLTSEDVNNLAYSRLLKRFNREKLLPSLVKLLEQVAALALEHIDTVMLGRTHGVPAVPTTFGKFLANYAYRIARIAEELLSFRFPGKLGGAVGDHSALKFAYPDIDWVEFSRTFVESLGLEYFPAATQILPHDKVSEYLMKVALMDSILSNLCRDLWLMSSLGLVTFGIKEGEIHSSTMPHKSNPIPLENSEGAFDLASNTLSYISTRLISSRLQRDLSDSIIKRFYGMPLSLTILGITNLQKAFDRMTVNKEKMKDEVKSHREVLAEAYQVYMRRMGIENAYEMIQSAVKEGWDEILRTLKSAVPEEIYDDLSNFDPTRYVGESEKVTLTLLDEVERVYKKITEGLKEVQL
ncbi:MAG: adenylosuccinate lyase [Thaumarchaeota archaeon]|nr:adenylosuccinate lyase [Nitrososphaerota archaeon]